MKNLMLLLSKGKAISTFLKDKLPISISVFLFVFLLSFFPANAMRERDYKCSNLYQLISRQIEKKFTAPPNILTESIIAQRVTSDIVSVDSLGSQVPFNCPACGGVLWKIAGSTSARYRCHTGHAYTTQTLLADQRMKIEETTWTALRMFEERKICW